MKNSKNLITLVFIAITVSCNDQNKGIMSKVEKLETDMQYQIDSLKTQLKYIHLKIDSISGQRRVESKSVLKLDIPMFIGKSMKYIKNFWSTRIPNEYFDEGTYNDTKEEYFSIMVGNVGKPEFTASFNKNGLCNRHMTKIRYSDISVMQARLMKAGYKYDTSCKCWKYPGVNHIWTINGPYGSDYELICAKK